MQSMVEHRLELSRHATRALELEGGGPGIVLLHGWGDSADTWRPLLAELAARDRRAIAVDLPGFGEATRLRPGRSWTRSRPSWSGTGPAAGRSSSPARRSAAASRCGSRSAASCRSRA
jgi:pimeloyl-ACP methyl ester carboxylesterase